jgi:hypothetical protein
MANDPMREELCCLVRALQAHDIKLIIGGGYGLVLRTEYILQSGRQTRFADIPQARSTNDFDFLLSAEIISEADKFGKIRDVLQELGYKAVETAKFYQFVRPIAFAGLPEKIKVDLLAFPAPGIKGLKVDKRRFRLKSVKEIHAHIMPEALTAEETPLLVNVASSGEIAEIFVPHPFSYLLMKLFALRDRLEDEEKDFGAYHAFDIYRVIAMMTEEEWEQACTLRDKFAGEAKILEARQIVSKLFSSMESTGVLRIRQHAKADDTTVKDENISALLDDLQELFPTIP